MQVKGKVTLYQSPALHPCFLFLDMGNVIKFCVFWISCVLNKSESKVFLQFMVPGNIHSLLFTPAPPPPPPKAIEMSEGVGEGSSKGI